jgi:hypothetical protein
MALLQPILAQALINYYQTQEQTNIQSATAFAHSYIDNYANNCTYVLPGTLSPLLNVIAQIVAAVPPVPVPGIYALAIDSALVAFWAAASAVMVPGAVSCTTTVPGLGAELILASVTTAALAGTPINGLAQLMAAALDTYTRTFIVSFATGDVSPLA